MAIVAEEGKTGWTRLASSSASWHRLCMAADGKSKHRGVPWAAAPPQLPSCWPLVPCPRDHPCHVPWTPPGPPCPVQPPLPGLTRSLPVRPGLLSCRGGASSHPPRPERVSLAQKPPCSPLLRMWVPTEGHQGSVSNCPPTPVPGDLLSSWSGAAPAAWDHRCEALLPPAGTLLSSAAQRPPVFRGPLECGLL